MTQIAPRTQARLPLRAQLRARRRAPLLREVYGQLIRRLRGRQGRTLTDVASRAGVSVAYLSEIERGLKEPSSEVLEAVCTALGSSIAHLVGAAHRELVLDTGDSGLGLGASGHDETDDVEEPGEAVGDAVLDLTRWHPGRSSVIDESNLTASARLHEATLIAA